MKEIDRVWTVPNVLSLMRLFLLIPIIVCLAHERRIWALFLMIFGVATDFLDGYIARRWKQFSDFGRILDPAIDKINVVVVSLFMVISPAYHFPLWFFVFILIRETVVMFCSLLTFRKTKIVIESNRPGKNSAFATGMVVLLFMMGLQPYGWIILWIALGLTLYSTTVYFFVFVQRMKRVSSPGV